MKAIHKDSQLHIPPVTDVEFLDGVDVAGESGVMMSLVHTQQLSEFILGNFNLIRYSLEKNFPHEINREILMPV